MAFNFENLRVWKKSLELTNEVYLLTKDFPKDEIYVLSSQIRRAADSVNLNIAEGSTGQSKAEFKKFLGYSIRSAIEVISCLYIGKERKIIADENFNRLYQEFEELIISIQALRKSL